MRPPAFWREPPGLATALLAPFGFLLGRLTLARMERPGFDPGLPVICVGNPTVGGAGKTPMTRLVAARLRGAGESPVILLRGYGGRLKGPVVVDPAIHDAAMVGDEALLHATDGPTIVAADRRAGAILAKARGASVIVMDDGFQNPALTKTRSLLMIDGEAGVENGCVFPAGPLRAPLEPQLKRADAVAVIGPGEAGAKVAALARVLGKPVLTGRLQVDESDRAFLAGRDVVAFCGIGRPAKFAETLGAAGARNAVLRPFPDHHAFTEEDARRLLTEADRLSLPLVTTEKDAVRLKDAAGRRATLASASRPIRVSLELEDVRSLDALIGISAPSRPAGGA